MRTRADLTNQVVHLERTVRELQNHLRHLEVQMGHVRGEQPHTQSWWQSVWRRGGGGGQAATLSGRVRENKRRGTHEQIRQSHLYYA